MSKPPPTPPTPPTPPSGSARAHRFLPPGDLFASADPTIVTTVVGSGVAICLFHADRRTAGLCHYTLPLCPQRTTSSTRFGDSSFRALIARLEELGCAAEGMTARVFGGSHISLHASPMRTLGDENVTVALNLLGTAGIPIVERGVGGNKGRQLAYRTDDGTITIRML